MAPFLDWDPGLDQQKGSMHLFPLDFRLWSLYASSCYKLLPPCLPHCDGLYVPLHWDPFSSKLHWSKSFITAVRKERKTLPMWADCGSSFSLPSRGGVLGGGPRNRRGSPVKRREGCPEDGNSTYQGLVSRAGREGHIRELPECGLELRPVS